jgi:hypothetical protein
MRDLDKYQRTSSEIAMATTWNRVLEALISEPGKIGKIAMTPNGIDIRYSH